MVGIVSHANFVSQGVKINGSATVVENLSDAAAMATASSAWTLVDGVPVLTVFKDIQP